MPAKNALKSRTRTPTRGRSKSVGRSPKRSRSRTPTRSRSRVRSTTEPKRTRTPDSESKVHKRRSSDSSSASSSPKRSSSRSAKVVLNRVDRASKAVVHVRETIPSRVSQRIVQKTEHISTSLVQNRVLQPEPCCEKIDRFFRETICPSWFMALLCIVSMLPFTCWLNFLIFAPSPSRKFGPESNVPTTLWGPAVSFAGVLWPTDIKQYFNIWCHLFVLAYLLVHFLIARFVPINFPIGLYGVRRPEYRSNGIFAMLFFGGLYAFAQFHPMVPAFARPTALLPKYWFSMLIATGKFSALFSLIAYLASKHLPRSQLCPEGNTSNFFVDFWVGRSIRPRWFNFDWKMVCMRPGVIAMLLVETTYLLTQWERFGRVSPALAALVVMHTVWLTDAVVFEYAMQYTFELRYEGFGYYAIGGVFLLPFIYSITASFLSSRPDFMRLTMNNKGEPDYAHYALLSISMVMFMVGYWIYRASNNQKDLFRRQPTHPSFSDFDKISGPHSQRLLAGGWWGVVRHPNYFGDLIMAYAMGLVTGCESIIPWLYPLFLTALLCHRIWRTEYRNAEKYGLGMTMYKKLVPSKLIPKIY